MKVRIIWVVVIAAIALLLVFGADRRQTTTVSLRNEADVTLADVTIALAGKEIWNGQIEPGEKQYARGRPDRDGAVRISFRARNVGPDRAARLHRAIVEVLEEAVENAGTTLGETALDYVDSEGSTGAFQDLLAVYDREGEPCLRCGAPIRRIVQGQRSTYFCPGCQR